MGPTVIVGHIAEKYFRYLGTIPWWFYLVQLRLVSTFLYVGRVQVTCELVPTYFSAILVLNYYTVKKGKISGLYLLEKLLMSLKTT